MTDTTATATLLALAAEVEAAVPEIDEIVVQGTAAHLRLLNASEDVLLLTGAGGLLHGFYSRTERVFRDISVALHGADGVGDGWHARSLDLMATDVAGLRPPVISRESRRGMDEYRAFRHVFRNVYVFNLDARRVLPLLTALGPLWAQLRAELLAFALVLCQIAHAV